MKYSVPVQFLNHAIYIQIVYRLYTEFMYRFPYEKFGYVFDKVWIKFFPYKKCILVGYGKMHNSVLLKTYHLYRYYVWQIQNLVIEFMAKITDLIIIVMPVKFIIYNLLNYRLIPVKFKI